MKLNNYLYIKLFIIFIVIKWMNITYANPTPIECFDYDEVNSYITITGYSFDQIWCNSDIEIPWEIDWKIINTIWENAFNREWLNKKLDSVVFPDSIVEIWWWAFLENNITFINLPRDTKIIKTSAFRNNNISNITFWDNLTEIWWWAFRWNSIKNIDLPQSLRVIWQYAFSKNIIEKLEIPSSVNNIQWRSFYNNNIDEIIINHSSSSLKLWPNVFGRQTISGQLFDNIWWLSNEALSFSWIFTLDYNSKSWVSIWYTQDTKNSISIVYKDTIIKDIVVFYEDIYDLFADNTSLKSDLDSMIWLDTTEFISKQKWVILYKNHKYMIVNHKKANKIIYNIIFWPILNEIVRNKSKEIYETRDGCLIYII